MSTYTEHADHEGLAQRLAVLASRADRETMLRTLQERDIGCVTLTMSKRELQARLKDARWLHNPWRETELRLLAHFANTERAQP
jgi:hypothetical protein